jgi:hypothetical protein
MENYVTCKSFSCFAVLQQALEPRLRVEQSVYFRNGVDGNLDGIRRYFDCFKKCRPFDVELPFFRKRVEIHLKELENYIETGNWERIN